MPASDQKARELLETAEWNEMSPAERHAVEDLLRRIRVARNANRLFLDGRTLGERLSDAIARVGGSWGFIIAFLLLLVAWAVLNIDILGPRGKAFDPYPFVFLNLILSMLAAIQAPIIMMSQNRAAERDRVQAASDYEVNVKAEVEIERLHEKFDELRERRWAELVALQQEQIRLLEALALGRGGAAGSGGQAPQA